MSDQLDMPTDEGPVMFATDETLDRRIRQLENAILDFEARLPGLRRDLDELKALAHPEGSQRDQAFQGST